MFTKKLSFLALGFCSSVLPASEESTHNFKEEILPILDRYCIRCHGDRKQKGEVRLDQLDPDIINGPDAEKWHAALDVINTQDMPPEDVRQPDSEQRRLLVNWLTSNLKKAKEIKRGKQNTVIRRLNRDQYNNAIKELLGITIDYGKLLPPDGLSHMGFSNSGKTLNSSPLHIEYYQEIARKALTKAIGPEKKPAVNHYRLEFGDNISDKVYATISGYRTKDLSGKHFHTKVLDEDGKELMDSQIAPNGQKVEDIKKNIMVDFRGSKGRRYGMTPTGISLYGALPHKEKAPESWQGPDPNLKMLIRNDFPEQGDFVFRVKAIKGNYFSPFNKFNEGIVATRYATAKYQARQLSLPENSIVLEPIHAQTFTNLSVKDEKFSGNNKDQVSEAYFDLSIKTDGYYQFDVLRPNYKNLKGQKKLQIHLNGEMIEIRATAKKDKLIKEDKIVQAAAFGFMKKGQYKLRLYANNFMDFNKLIVSPADKRNTIYRKYENELLNMKRNTEVYKDSRPVLRTFIGTRGDDGMDYSFFDHAKQLNHKITTPQNMEFFGRLENLPIPTKDLSSDNPLANIMIIGVHNEYLAKVADDYGPSLEIQSVEFEAPYFKSWPMESYKQIFPEANDKGSEAYTRRIMSAFINRAFRKKVDKRIVDRYFHFWQAVRGDYLRYEDGVKEALIAVLCSAEFLYIAEPGKEQLESFIDEFQLANRLAFFLWNGLPDDELYRLAEQGLLSKNIDAQIKRMINDPKIDQFLQSFAREWLRLDRLQNINVNIDKYPSFTRFIKQDMEKETYAFLRYVLQKNLSIINFIDSNFAVINQNMAEFYGIKDLKGPAFRPVKMDPKLNRGGLITQASFLTGHSDGEQAHPIKRAVWLMEKLLDDEPPPPPPNVPLIDPEMPSFKGLTIKQQLELHREKESCNDCHQKIDPWGVVFENYNAIGLYEAGADAQTELLDGTELNGINELKQYLLANKKPDLTRSVIKHLLAYGLGRDISYMDNEDIEEIVRSTEANDYAFQDLVASIIKHEIFRRR